MSGLVSFAGQSVTRVRASLVADRYGNQTRDWSATVSATITDCSVQPVTAPEQVQPTRDGIVTRYLLIAPAGTDLLATDRLQVGDVTFEVDGAPLVYSAGVLDHVEAFLVRLDG